jgi:hypothetical protein
MGALNRIAAASSVRILAVCSLVGLAAVAGLLLLSHSASAPAIAPAAPVEVSASFDPAFVQFGDRITARVVVALDIRRVHTQTLQLTDDLAPLTQLGPARTARSTRGSLELVTVTVPVACLTSGCVGSSGEARIGLPLVRTSVLGQGGRTVRAFARWPELSVRGRVIASDLKASSPPFEADAEPPAATYRIAPTTLATLLDLLAALFAFSAIGLAGRQVHLRHRRQRPQPEALEHALRLTRQAERRAPADRRRALALLSRALGGDRRSGAARRLAWSEPTPEPDELEELVSEIEQQRSE